MSPQGPSSVPMLLASATAVGAGGFVGALARWATGALAAHTLGARFAWGTLAANLIGCFAMGALKTWLDRSGALHPLVTMGLLTGFLGAYTTFSTFAFDTLSLQRDAGSRVALTYVALSVVGGLGACVLGARLAGLR